MGIPKRRQRESDGRRLQILSAAQSIFPAKGFRKTTMEDVAREAELGTGTLYLYFKSKDELYVSLTFGFIQRFISLLEHIDTEQDAKPPWIIKNLIDATVDVYEFDPEMLVHFVHLQSSETLRKIPPQPKSELKELFRSSREAMARIVISSMTIGSDKKKNRLFSQIFFGRCFQSLSFDGKAKNSLTTARATCGSV